MRICFGNIVKSRVPLTYLINYEFDTAAMSCPVLNVNAVLYLYLGSTFARLKPIASNAELSISEGADGDE